MTAAAARPGPAVALLLAGFAAALALRLMIGAPTVAGSAPAGLVFAAALAALAWAARVGLPVGLRAVVAGLVGAAVLVAPVPLMAGGHRPVGAFLPWAAVVSAVAVAEEGFLRGALYGAVRRWRGTAAALTVTTLAFAALHVPLYGVRSVPLDAAVGLLLGVLREVTGAWTAPAIAHTGADLIGWWLR
jgi:membrane protease YdiL (CAAX protease family)